MRSIPTTGFHDDMSVLKQNYAEH
jgi:hypothetical protein